MLYDLKALKKLHLAFSKLKVGAFSGLNKNAPYIDSGFECLADRVRPFWNRCACWKRCVTVEVGLLRFFIFLHFVTCSFSLGNFFKFIF